MLRTPWKGPLQIHIVSGLFKRADVYSVDADIEELEVAIEETVKRLGGTAGWGGAGGVLLGPVGLLAGTARAGTRFQSLNNLLLQTSAMAE